MSLNAAAVAVLWTALQFWNPFAPPPTPTRADVAQCLGADQPSVRRVRVDGIFFCGRIDDQSMSWLREELLPTDRTLLIASFGGDLDAPVRLGELVRDRRLDVVVVGPCLSGCASFVFVAARNRSVAAGGMLGLHNTATSAVQLARAANALSEQDRPLELRAQREAALYASLGIAPSLLLEPQVRLETLCIREGGTDARTGETRFLIHSRYSLWAPTRAQWRTYGVTYSGSPPVDASQSQRLLDTLAAAGLAQGANITMSNLALRAPPETYLADVAPCTPGVR